MYIRLQVKNRIQNQAKMFRNVRCSCWNKYVNEHEQQLNGSSPANPVNDRREANAVTLKSTFRLS